jgi:hypothetical protein
VYASSDCNLSGALSGNLSQSVCNSVKLKEDNNKKSGSTASYKFGTRVKLSGAGTILYKWVSGKDTEKHFESKADAKDWKEYEKALKAPVGKNTLLYKVDGSAKRYEKYFNVGNPTYIKNISATMSKMGGKLGLDLRWSIADNSKIDKVVIYRSTDLATIKQDASKYITNDVTDITLTDYNIKPFTKYYYRIAGYDAAGKLRDGKTVEVSILGL